MLQTCPNARLEAEVSLGGGIHNSSAPTHWTLRPKTRLPQSKSAIWSATNVLPTPDAPTYIGVLDEAGKAAVMLDNPTGWITFIDTDTGDIDQVNSFELNSFIQ